MEAELFTDEQRFSELVRTAILSVERARHTSVSQKQVAEEIGISHRALQEWLGGRRTPQGAVAMLRLICLVPDQEERMKLLSMWHESAALRAE